MFNFFSQNSLFKEGLSSVLLITMLLLAGGYIFFAPKPAKALVPDIIGGVPNIIKMLWSFISDSMDRIKQVAQAAYAAVSAAYDKWQKSETLLAQAARVAAQVALYQILSMMTNQIVEWIQGGGEPRFITDWEGFLGDAADKAGGKFIDQYLGAGWLCKEFDLDIKIALLDVPRFEDRVKCTLTDIVDNISDFADNFSNGGWKGWLSLTEPQNNFYGAYLMASNEKMKKEAEALQAAIQESAAGSGFISPRACVVGHLEGEGNEGETCSTKEECDDLKGEFGFVCDREIITTPAAIVSDMTSKIVNQPLELIQAQMADLADSMGPLGPYIVAIGDALTNRVIKEGLAFIDSSGPTLSDPSASAPPGSAISPVDRTPVQATIDEGDAATLLSQQELLGENIKTLYLPQQQSNLNAMFSIKSIQDSILNALVNTLMSGCSLPSWASSQVTNTATTVTDDAETTIETIQVTANNVGNITIKKTTVVVSDSEDNNTTVSYSTEKIEAQMDSQIAIMKEEINKTNQWIADIATAVASTKGFAKIIGEYLELYQNTLQPPTAQEQAALDEKKQSILASKELVIANAQKIAESDSDAFNDLEVDTQNISIKTVEKTNNLLQARGFDEQYPFAGTLYAQKQELAPKLSEAQSSSNCTNNNNDGN